MSFFLQRPRKLSSPHTYATAAGVHASQTICPPPHIYENSKTCHKREHITRKQEKKIVTRFALNGKTGRNLCGASRTPRCEVCVCVCVRLSMISACIARTRISHHRRSSSLPLLCWLIDRSIYENPHGICMQNTQPHTQTYMCIALAEDECRPTPPELNSANQVPAIIYQIHSRRRKNTKQRND